MRSIQIPDPSYTQTPTVFYDEIFATLKEEGLRLVLFLIRNTLGFKKTYKPLSLSHLSQVTGMKRDSAVCSMNVLIEKKVVKNKKEMGI